MFRENIGENLRRLRKRKKGLSVAKVVDIVNRNGYELSVDTYYKWERGTRKPPCDAIPYLAEALQTTEGRIFHLHEEEQMVKLSEHESLKGEFWELFPEVAEVLENIKKQKNIDSYFLFFLAGICAAMDKEDRNLVSSLIIRLYEYKVHKK